MKGWESMKKTMKRSLALGALMAFVITGSAMAGNIGLTTVNGKVEKVNPSGKFTVGTDGDVVKIQSFSHGISLIEAKDFGEVWGKNITIDAGNNNSSRGL